MKPNSDDNELDYALLQQIAREELTSQRALAERLGVSLGKINYCLRAVIDKGWVKANNFRRADNKWGYVYLLTPTGVSEKMRLTRTFLERKEREFEELQREISELRREVRPGPTNNE